MTRRCDECGERLEAEFTVCWRCGAELPTPDAGDETDDADDLVSFERFLEEEERQGSRARALHQERIAHVQAYARERGRDPVLAPADPAIAAGNRLFRLVEAFRLHRARRESATARPRPDLDRRWLQFFLACAGLGGFLLAAMTSDALADWLLADAGRFHLFYVPLLVASVVTGARAVRGELRADAEEAVRRCYRARS